MCKTCRFINVALTKKDGCVFALLNSNRKCNRMFPLYRVHHQQHDRSFRDKGVVHRQGAFWRLGPRWAVCVRRTLSSLHAIKRVTLQR